MKKSEEQRVSSGCRAYLYISSCWPCRSALNSPYSLRYLAFRLPSRMPYPALRGPLVMSRCIIDRSATYLGRFFGALANRLTKTFEPRPRSIGKGSPQRCSSSFSHRSRL